MGKLGEEEETKMDNTSEVLSEDSDMDVKKETEQFIPVPRVEVVKKKRVLSDKQCEALHCREDERNGYNWLKKRECECIHKSLLNSQTNRKLKLYWRSILETMSKNKPKPNVNDRTHLYNRCTCQKVKNRTTVMIFLKRYLC